MTYYRQVLIGAVSAALLLAVNPISALAAWWTLDQGSRSATIAPSPDAPVVLAQAGPGADERFNRVESQMRSLTGQVEELTFQLRQIQAQLKLMQEDNEFRFRDLEGGGQPPPRPDAVSNNPAPPPPQRPDPPIFPAQSATGSNAIDANQASLAPNVPRLGEPGSAPLSLGSLPATPPPADAADQPIDLTAPLPPTLAPPGPNLAAIQPTGDARTDYDRAYRIILSGDYSTAEVALRQFLTSYPDDQLAPDAQYWLGESLFVRAQFRDAANEFLAGYKTFPKSGKAPDSLLKLGLSLAGLGEREAACSTFAAVLKQFPNASNALLQRVDFEQASASC